MAVRTQLTLFLPEAEARLIESVRRVVDPIQFQLIAAHVTLCREDELVDLDPGELGARFDGGTAKPITLRFGRPEAFHDHGILLPCIDGEKEFRSLRMVALGSNEIRRQTPHITLAHPRNPNSAGNSLENAQVLPETISVTFTSVSLIEQTDAMPWRVKRTFDLRKEP